MTQNTKDVALQICFSQTIVYVKVVYMLQCMLSVA